MLIMVYIWWLNVYLYTYIYVDFQMEEWMVYNVFFYGFVIDFVLVLIYVFNMCLMKV